MNTMRTNVHLAGRPELAPLIATLCAQLRREFEQYILPLEHNPRASVSAMSVLDTGTTDSSLHEE